MRRHSLPLLLLLLFPPSAWGAGPAADSLLLIREGNASSEALLLEPTGEPGKYRLTRLGAPDSEPATYRLSRFRPEGTPNPPVDPPPDVPPEPPSDPAGAAGAAYRAILLEGQAQALEGLPEGVNAKELAAALRAGLDTAYADAKRTLNVELSRALPITERTDPSEARAFLRAVAAGIRGATR